ncbi:unnamed protein product [Clonostachys byssicola]|uniref:Uncharacterized protein n=1 Tax=Clonostachys byssicola TaxID=160290 RepID=A0A9N9UC41_9HYPO|nr:unnamed protein product [Clonostachys byssicola]
MSLCEGLIAPNQPPKAGPPLLVEPFRENGALTSFSISHSNTIAAPPLQCIQKLMDTSTWPEWCKMTPRANITHTPPIADDTTNVPELQALISRPGYLYRGVKFTADVHMDLDPAKKTNTAAELVRAVERFELDDGRTGYRLAWEYVGLPSFVSCNVRVFEFIEAKERLVDGELATEAYGWETFSGLGSWLQRSLMSDKLLRGYESWGEDFKNAVESQMEAPRG